VEDVTSSGRNRINKTIHQISALFARHTLRTNMSVKKVSRNSNWWKNCTLWREEIFHEDVS